MGDSRGIDGSEGGGFLSVWCNWSDNPEILRALLAEFGNTGAGAGGVASGDGGGRGGRGGEVDGVAAEAGRRADEAKGDAGGGGGDEEEEDGERVNLRMHLSEVCMRNRPFIYFNVRTCICFV